MANKDIFTIPTDASIVGQWILDYLTEHPQYVMTQGCVSDTLSTVRWPHREL